MVSPSVRLARGLPHQAPVDALPPLAQHFDHPARAVDRRAFLIAGDQKGDGAAMRRDTAPTNSSLAVTIAAKPLFMSAAPRP